MSVESKEPITSETFRVKMADKYAELDIVWQEARNGKKSTKYEANALNAIRDEIAQTAAEAIDALGVDEVIRIVKKEIKSFITHEFEMIKMLTQILKRYVVISQAKTKTEEHPLPEVVDTETQVSNVLDQKD